MSPRTIGHATVNRQGVGAGLRLEWPPPVYWKHHSTRDGRTRPAPIFERCRGDAATKGGDRDDP